MKNHLWSDFRDTAIKAYENIPEAGINCMEQFNDLFKGVPTVPRCDWWEIKSLSSKQESGDTEKLIEYAKILFVNEFKNSFGASTGASKYYVALNFDGIPVLFVEDTALGDRGGVIGRLFLTGGNIAYRQRLQCSFAYSKRNKQVAFYPTMSYYLERHQKFKVWVFPMAFFIGVLIFTLFGFEGTFPQFALALLVILALFSAPLLLLWPVIAYLHKPKKLSPEDNKSYDPMDATNRDKQRPYIRKWIKENCDDLTSVCRKSTRNTGFLVREITEKPPASCSSPLE